MTRMLALILAATLLAPLPAAAETRFIVRAAPSSLSGLNAISTACQLAACAVRYRLDGDLGRVFLVTTGDLIDASSFAVLLRSLNWLIDTVEVDQVVSTTADEGVEVPAALLDAGAANYGGTTVRGGYVRQPAFGILGIGVAQAASGATGAGITVAVIDTGVDPAHPVLAQALLRGYDFTRNREGGSELSDLGDQSTVAVLDQAHPAWVNQSTVAVLDQSTVAVLDQGHAGDAFGHGTMVAGVVHLAAPGARILPLKAFSSDGNGYASDILRAIHYAVKANAKVINMSFSFSTPSREIQRAIDFATARGVVSVASVGNDGSRVNTWPAAWPAVIGVASTTNQDALSAFSNFGPQVAWVAAPGEGIVTLYPFATYAAAWGTSFSAPFAAGTAAVLAQIRSNVTPAAVKDAEGHARPITQEVNRGRLDVPAAVAAVAP
jgi:subtilisin family serine protease